MLAARSSRIALLALGALCALPLASCEKKGPRGQSDLANWIDSPTKGTKDGNVIKIAALGVKLELPETLYVFKNCGEASHSPDSFNREWIPVMVCNSSGEETFSGGGEEEGDDPFAEDEETESGAEPVELTFYVTKKTRPIDERAVTWFEGQFKQAGLSVSDISYQHEYHKKAGIYAKLHVVDGSSGEPEREIVQFMFPREDVVFIARMEYPFGESRPVDADWQALLWYFDFTAAAEAG